MVDLLLNVNIILSLVNIGNFVSLFRFDFIFKTK